MARRWFRPLLLASLAASLLTPAGAHADPVEDLNVGLVLTLEAPETYRPGETLTVSGHLRFQAGLPIVFETAHGLPGQTITLLLDGEPHASLITDDEGRWATQLQFDGMPPYRHELRAVAFTGTPAETSSRTAPVRRELLFTDLHIVPGSAVLVVDGGIQLQAIVLDGDGREHDVSEQADWSSSDPSVVSVSNEPGSRGSAIGVASGSATITVTFEAFSAQALLSVE